MTTPLFHQKEKKKNQEREAVVTSCEIGRILKNYPD